MESLPKIKTPRQGKAVGTSTRYQNRSPKTLMEMCRDVIVSNLERYPPEAFGICDEELWISILELRHKRSCPKEGSGGLDGTGRMVPAVSDKFLESVEQCNPHLSDCSVADEMLWRDCVEYRFRRGGLTRPEALLWPWPVLIEHTKSICTSLLVEDPSTNQINMESTIKDPIAYLTKAPMSVSLLRDSGAGKILKKAIKSASNTMDQDVLNQMKKILSSWMALAANSGIDMKSHERELSIHDSIRTEDANDLAVAETCLTWRHLFRALKVREEERRQSQGKRMRELRRTVSVSLS